MGLPEWLIQAQVGHVAPDMMKTYSHIRRQALNEAAAALDDVRNWLQLGLQPAKGYENRRQVRMSSGGSGEVEISHGASEAEQLFDPERA